jgi:DNA-directed RNA polymerase subunit RPC12/RpoP
MSGSQARELIEIGITCAKSGDLRDARRYLEWGLRLTHDRQLRLRAWHWLSRISADPKEKRELLANILAHDPLHSQARRDLAVLDGKISPGDIIDPNTFQQNPVSENESKADRFTCPNCGGRMAFAPDGQTLVCESCDNDQAIDPADNSIDEQDFVVAMATKRGHTKPVSMHAFHCEGCGIEFLLPPETITATCSYCGSSYVVAVNETRETIPPEAVIPFAFDQDQAAQRWLDWFRQEKIKPTRRPDLPRGLYFPVWTFDITGETPWSIQVEIQEDRWITEQNNTPFIFWEVRVPAAKQTPKFANQAIDHFDLKGLIPYDPRYLVNFPAEIQQSSLAQASLLAREKAVKRARAEIKNNARYSYTQPTRGFSASSSRVMADAFKLILVPLWLSSYIVKDETFAVMINGQTGEIHAEKPKFDLMDWLDDLDRKIFGE